MADWWEQYLGKPWKAEPSPPNSFNCGELLRYIYRTHLGRQPGEIIADPSDVRQCINAMTVAQVYGLEPSEYDRIPQQYDVLFMARNKYIDHCGIAVDTSAGLMILHCKQGPGVIIETLFEIGTAFRRCDWFKPISLEPTETIQCLKYL